MKRMTEKLAKEYLEKKYPDADIFPGVIKGGLRDVMVAQRNGKDLEVIITG